MKLLAPPRRTLYAAVLPPRLRAVLGLPASRYGRWTLSPTQYHALLVELGLESTAPAAPLTVAPSFDVRGPEPLFPHQEAGLAFLDDHDGRGMLAWEMGLGKTRAVIEWASRKGLLDQTLVIAPLSVLPTWVAQMREWAPGILPRVATADRRSELAHPTGPWLTNVDALRARYDKKKRKWVGTEALDLALARKPRLVVVDESTKVKSPTAQRTRGVWLVAWRAPHVVLLSGLPTPHSPLDLWAQVRCLEEKKPLGFTARGGMKKRYSASEDKFGNVRKWHDLDDLYDRLGQVAHRATKRECLGLPEKLYVRREVPWDAAGKKAYREVVREGRTIVQDVLKGGDRELLARTVVEQMIRLQQVTGGLGNGAKLAALDELRDEIPDGPLIVWARFTDEIERLRRHLPGARAIRGETPYKERLAIVEGFKAGTIPFLVANPAAAGHGIDGLQTVCDTAVYWSNDFNLEHRQQSEDRIHRARMKDSCTLIDLVIPGTIDMRVLEAHRRKANLARQVLDDPMGIFEDA